jgi:hypothetical protein
MTFVDCVDKDYPGFRNQYNNSEFAHPNYAGTGHPYANCRADFGTNTDGFVESKSIGVTNLTWP